MDVKRKRRKRKDRTRRRGVNWKGCTQFSATTSSCACWPFHNSSSLIWTSVTLTNGTTGSMALRLLEGNLLPRNAWRQICQLMADGATLKGALKSMRENQLFWTRSTSGSCSNNFAHPESPRARAKEKERARPRWPGKGVYQDHLESSPADTRAEVKRKVTSREDAPVPGLLTGRSNPRRLAGTSA